MLSQLHRLLAPQTRAAALTLPGQLGFMTIMYGFSGLLFWAVSGQVLVAVLTGVPTDYDGGRIYYADGTDPEFLRETGIGAGCESVNGKAAPVCTAITLIYVQK